MKVWGLGTCYGGYDDQTKLFLNSNIAAMGWNENDAIDLYAMMREVEIGDIIYLKSSYPKKGEGMILRIKAIGRVVNPNIKHNGKCAIGVEYIKNFKSIDLNLREYKGRNSVYTSTFYQEYNPRIIEKLLMTVKQIENKKGCVSNEKIFNYMCIIGNADFLNSVR